MSEDKSKYQQSIEALTEDHFVELTKLVESEKARRGQGNFEHVRMMSETDFRAFQREQAREYEERKRNG